MPHHDSARPDRGRTRAVGDRHAVQLRRIHRDRLVDGHRGERRDRDGRRDQPEAERGHAELRGLS